MEIDKHDDDDNKNILYNIIIFLTWIDYINNSGYFCCCK